MWLLSVSAAGAVRLDRSSDIELTSYFVTELIMKAAMEAVKHRGEIHMGQMDGRVTLITGAARGQGRAHAVRLAEEGSDIVALDILADVDALTYRLATQADMDETGRLVRATGREIVTCRADVRSQADLDAAVVAGLDAFGHIDTVVINAGISGKKAPTWELDTETFERLLDINVLGAQRTIKAVVPTMIETGKGGAIVFINSNLGIKARPNLAAYSASKHALIGLMQSLAIELAPHSIRVNSVNPSGVGTELIFNEATYREFCPGVENPTLEDAIEGFKKLNLLPVPWVEPVDVANAVLFLASVQARYVTGVALPVDAGNLTRV